MDIKVNDKTIICFDLDDTMYNEVDYLRSAYIEIAKHLDRTDYNILFAKMFSLYRKKENVFEYLSKEYKIDTNNLLKLYRNHFPDITPFFSLVELIEKIKNLEGKLVIITDGRSITQRNKLKALRVIDLMDKIIISEEIGSEKPSIQNFKMVEEFYPNCSYTYIGDNFKKDFITPNALGWATVGLIDNGKNIHNNTFDHFNNKTAPKNIVLQLSEINII